MTFIWILQHLIYYFKPLIVFLLKTYKFLNKIFWEYVEKQAKIIDFDILRVQMKKSVKLSDIFLTFFDASRPPTHQSLCQQIFWRCLLAILDIFVKNCAFFTFISDYKFPCSTIKKVLEFFVNLVGWKTKTDICNRDLGKFYGPMGFWL